MKKLNLKQSSGSGKPQTEADSGTAEPEVDLSPILSLPSSVFETGIVDQTNFVAVLEALTLVETTVDFHKKVVSPNFHKFLSFGLNLLELGVKSDSGFGLRTTFSSDPSSSLQPIELSIRLRPRESFDLKRR